MSWDDVSFIVHSKTRKAVLLELENEKTPTILAKKLHTSLPNISRALRDLQDKDLVDPLTPDSRIGKIFVASSKGKKVIDKLKQMD